MERYNFKQYMFVLSTVGMLNSACNYGSGRLGLAVPDEVPLYSSIPYSADIQEACKQTEPYVNLYLPGIGKNRGNKNQFAELQKCQWGCTQGNVIPLNSECRKSGGDFTRSISEQAEAVFEEYNEFPELTEVKEFLSKKYKWTEDEIKQGWKNLQLVITAHSQGTLVALDFDEKYKDKLNIKALELINGPFMGLAFLKCTLTQILEIQNMLSMGQSLLPFPVEDLVIVSKEAEKNGLGGVKLVELVDSQNDYNQEPIYQEFLQAACTQKLVKRLKEEYKGLMDIESYAEKAWKHIRRGEIQCSNSPENKNNNTKARIHLIHSCIDESTLNQLMGKLAGFITPIITPIITSIKVINGMPPTDSLGLTDTVITAGGGICKRPGSFRGGELEQKWKDMGHKKFLNLSPKECEDCGYKPNVDVTIGKGHIHEMCSVPIVKNILPGTLLDSPECYLVIMNHVDNCLTSTTNTVEDTTPTLQDDDLD